MTDKLNAYAKQYYKDNKEEILAYKKRHNKNNKRKQAYDRQYAKDHKEGRAAIQLAYFQSLAGKEADRKKKCIRRGLGFIMLNKPFEGCEGHHISQNFVIYMPRELHQALYHNIWTWQSMEEMNKLAIQWL